MELFNRLVEKIIRLQRRMRRWNRMLLSVSMVVVFVTTYAMILPALTLDEAEANQQPGIVLETTEESSQESAASDMGVGEEQVENVSLEAAASEETTANETVEAQETASDTQNAENENPADSENQAAQENNTAETVNSSTGNSEAEGTAADSDKKQENTANADVTDTSSDSEESNDAAEGDQTRANTVPEAVAQVSTLSLTTEAYDWVVTFRNGATVPANTELKVRRVDQEAAYQVCLDAVRAAYDEIKAGELRTSLLYEISFLIDGEKYIPAADVMDVRITYKDNTVPHDEDIVDGCIFSGAVPGSASAEQVKAILLQKNADGSEVVTMREGIISAMEMKNLPIASEGNLVGLFAAVKPEDEYPAATFQQTVGSIRVLVEAPEGAFPEGTTMTVKSVDAEEVMDAVQKAVGVKEEIKTTTALDITFKNAAGEEIQPKKDIKVTFAPRKKSETFEESKIVHIDEAGEGSLVESTADKNAAVIEVDQFSVYVIVGTVTIETPAGELLFEGDGYTVKLTYTEESEIPIGTELTVNELEEGTEEYEEYVQRNEAALAGDEAELDVAQDNVDTQVNRLLSAFDETRTTRYLDITLRYNGEEIEPNPEHPIQVEVTFTDMELPDEEINAAVVHFADEGTEVINKVEVDVDDKGALTLAYEQGSFSMDALTMMQGRANAGWTNASNNYQLVFRYGYPATTAAQGAPVFELQYNGQNLNGTAGLDATTGAWPGEAGYPHTHGTNTGYMDGIINPGTTIQDLLFALKDANANTQAAIRGVQIILYDTYEVGATGEAWGFNKNPSASNFLKTIAITRGPGFSDTMIVNNSVMTTSDPRTNEPGRLMIHNTVIDNATGFATSSDPNKRDVVAVQCNEGALFMMGRELERGQTYERPFNNGITSWNYFSMNSYLGYFSTAIINSNDAGHGTGVLLTNTSGGTGHLPNYEYKSQPDYTDLAHNPGQTYAEVYGGSVETFLESYIEGQYMGVDSQYGKLRLKDATNPIRNNTVDVNLAYGNSISKWINSVAGIANNPIDIVLEDISRWKSGDVVMDSGLYWNPALTQAPVIPSDVNIFHLNRTGLTSEMGLEYYAGSSIYPYPVIRFFDGVVYNERTGQWYKNLYDAVTPGQVDIAGNPTSIQDGDSIVFYGSTVENNQVVINYDLTITAADSNDTLHDHVTQDSHGRYIHTDPYTAEYSNPNASQSDFIVISAGKTVTFGGNDDTTQGGLVLDARGKNSVIKNYGTLNLKADVSLENGTYGVIQNGQEHLYEGALFSGNTTADHLLISDGTPAGNHYITLETTNPNNGTVITNSLGAASTQYNGRDVVVAGTNGNIGSTLNNSYLARFTLTDKDDEYDYVYTVNGGPTGQRVLELKQKAAITVKVYKVDEDNNPLNGAGFTLYKVTGSTETPYTLGNETNPHTTSGNGVTQMSVREGSFKLRETTVPAGYDGAADLAFTVTNNNGTLTLTGATGTGFSLEAGSTDTYEVTVRNTKKTVPVTLEKIDTHGTTLSDVTFGLDSQTTTHRTGANGTVSLGTFKWGSSHTLLETWNDPRYKALSGAISISVNQTTGVLTATPASSDDTVTVRGDVTNGYTITVTNIPEKVKVALFKTGDDLNGSGLAGSAFTLTPTGGTAITLTASSTTGRFNTVELEAGIYTIAETTTPAGYETAANGTLTVTVNPSKSVAVSGTGYAISGPDANSVYTVTVTDVRKTVRATLRKVNAAGTALGGVTFGFDSETTNVTTGDGSGDTTLGEVSLGNLTYGTTHTLHETWSNPLYKPLNGDISIAIDRTTGALTATPATGDTVIVTGDATNGYTVTVVNQPRSLPVVIRKVDQAQQTLTGATLSLKQGSNELLTGTEITDIQQNGQVTLAVGRLNLNTVYTISESAAPSGYLPITSPISFQLVEDTSSQSGYSLKDANGGAWNNSTSPLKYEIQDNNGAKILVLKLTNSTGAELPSTGGHGTLLYTLSGLAFIFAAALMYGFRMRRRERRSN